MRIRFVAAAHATRLVSAGVALFAITACSPGRGPGSTSEEAAGVAGTGGPVLTGGAAGANAPEIPPESGERVVLAVRGMVCESCERTISVMLRRTPGVRGAEVSVARGEAVVTFDPARTNPAALVAVVQQLGYRATLRGSPPQGS